MENPFQLGFFRKLKQLLPGHISLVDAVAEILEISQDSAYRRIRGETALSVDEAIRLCGHYRIPITMFTENIPGLANFRYRPREQTLDNFGKYLAIIEKNIEELMLSDTKELIYAAVDAPIFYYFSMEPLARFKMHFWLNTILGVGDLKSTFRKNSIPADFIQQGRAIYEHSLRVPSIEIWSDDILNTTIRQIEYYWDSGYFVKKEEALDILDAMLVLVDHIFEMSESGHKTDILDKRKDPYESFAFYQSDVLLGGNTVFTKSEVKSTVYLSHHTFEALVTQDVLYCKDTESWLRQIISKSNLISGVSEKNRIRFFRKLRSGINESQKVIKGS